MEHVNHKYVDLSMIDMISVNISLVVIAKWDYLLKLI